MLREVVSMRRAHLVALGFLAAALEAHAVSWNFDRGDVRPFRNAEAADTRKLGKPGKAMSLGISQTNKWWHRRSGSEWKNEGYFNSAPNMWLCFSYYITAEANIRVVLTRADDKGFGEPEIPRAVPKKWMTAAFPVMDVRGMRSCGLPKGEKIVSITFSAGSEARAKKYDFECYIDDVTISRGLPPHVRGAIARQNKDLAAYTFEPAKDGMTLDRAIILRLAEGFKPSPSKGIAVVGDSLAMDDEFLTPLTKYPTGIPPSRGYAIDKSASEEGMTFVKARTAVKKLLSSNRPELIVLFVGYDEAKVYAEARKKDKVALKKGERKKDDPPTDQSLSAKARKALKKTCEEILAAGSIPILLTTPVRQTRRGSLRAPDADQMSCHAHVAIVGKALKIPFIDVYKSMELKSLLKKLLGKKPLTRDGVTKAGHKLVNERFRKMFKAIEKEILRKKKKRR